LLIFSEVPLLDILDMDATTNPKLVLSIGEETKPDIDRTYGT